MTRLPEEIRTALAFTLDEWQIAAAERANIADLCTVHEGFSPPHTADHEHILNLMRCVRDLLAAGHTESAIDVAIELGAIMGEDEWENSINATWRDRGKAEAEGIAKAALGRWGSPEERRKIDEEILAVAKEGIAASNRKQALHEVARVINERHPSLCITARKVRRVLTGN